MTPEQRRQEGLKEEEMLKRYAEETIGRMPVDLRNDLTVWARLMKTWHTGSDFRGERVVGEARLTLRRSLDHLQKTIASKYGQDHFGEIGHSWGLTVPQVRDRLAEKDAKS